jgi:Zn finger protein HypA/HybF involved in hydrogenase expression
LQHAERRVSSKSPPCTWSSANCRAWSTIRFSSTGISSAKGTIAEGARLLFERIPAAFHCLDCQTEFGRNDRYQCPACGSGRVAISAGEEFFLKSIEVEE